MSSSKIQELPANLAGTHLNHDAEIEKRRERLEELFKLPANELDVDEIKRLNDEVERLQDEAPLPHPGFPPPPGGWRSSSARNDGAKFGRLEGLGAAWVKAMGAKALDATAGGATLPGAFFDPRINDLPQRRLFVRSLIPTRSVTTDKVQFIRQTVFTNAAAAVAAGGVKPTTVISAAREEAPIRVIAHVSEAMDRMLLSDHDQLTQFIDSQLRLGVLLEEEDQIINGNGTPPNISGILDQASLQTQAKGADPTPDAVHKAITKVRNVFVEPDAVVFHPSDWEEVALLRNADGVYLWGSPSNEAEPRIWGKPVVVTPVIAQGTALVGAFGVAATVYEREGARVTFAETGLSDVAGEELFMKNQIRFRGESRLGLAIIRPDAFCSVTGV
jgi:HK97 family phage major capsid protein